MEFQGWCRTDVGCVREANQDTFALRPDIGLFVVADGMGGHQGGEVASVMAAATIQEVVETAVKAGGQDPRQVLHSAYREASFRIFNKGRTDKNLRGMATTMVSVWVVGNKIHVANVGDSRAYLLSPPHLWQITEDHSYFNEQLRAGLVQETDRENFEGKNIITRSVGFEPETIADVWEKEPKPGESLVLCSDGLTNMVKDTEIANICFTSPPSEVVDRLVDEARRNGGEDNITALYLAFS